MDCPMCNQMDGLIAEFPTTEYWHFSIIEGRVNATVHHDDAGLEDARIEHIICLNCDEEFTLDDLTRP